MKYQDGKVLWFDASSGEGIVVAETGESLYVHFSCIQDAPRAVDGRRYLIAGAHVKFTVYENLYSRRVDEIWG